MQRHTATAQPQGSHEWSHVKHTRKQPATNNASTRVVSISVLKSVLKVKRTEMSRTEMSRETRQY